jgi:hypothetical protein
MARTDDTSHDKTTLQCHVTRHNIQASTSRVNVSR